MHEDGHKSTGCVVASDPTKLGQMRVLVVEDEKKTAAFVRKALQAEGWEWSPRSG